LASIDPSSRPSLQEIQAVLQHSLGADHVQSLSHPVTDVEVYDTLFSLSVGKAPGPDGFNVEFFKRNWEVVGSSVIEAIKDFFFYLREIVARDK